MALRTKEIVFDDGMKLVMSELSVLSSFNLGRIKKEELSMEDLLKEMLGDQFKELAKVPQKEMIKIRAAYDELVKPPVGETPLSEHNSGEKKTSSTGQQ